MDTVVSIPSRQPPAKRRADGCRYGQGIRGIVRRFRSLHHPARPRRGRRAIPVRKPLWAIFVLSCLCALPARAQAGGDPEVGKSLFFGTTRFRNGGGVCGVRRAISWLAGG